MSNIADGLESYLRAQSSVTSFVSNRVYPQEIPESWDVNNGAAITFDLISDVPQYHHGGDCGIWAAVFQINCHAKTYSQSHQLAEAVRLVLSGYKGAMGDEDCQASLIQQMRDIPIHSPQNDTLRRKGVSIDVEIHYAADIPSFAL